MAPLEELTHATFAERLGETFRLEREGGAPLELTLASVSEISPEQPPGDRRAPFSIVFHGPHEPLLRQHIYRLEGAGLGALDIFIVPIGPAGDAMQYEAVFT